MSGFLSAGIVGGPDIPDSVVAQYNAQELTGFNDGDNVATRPTQVGGPDLIGSGTYQASGFNNYPSIDYNNTDESHTAAGSIINQKYVIYAVIDPAFSSTNDFETVVADGGGADVSLLYDGNNNAWVIYAGGRGVNGSSTVGRSLLTAVFDGANSVLREDGTQTGSGDPGGGNITLLSIGENTSGFGPRYWHGGVPFVEVHDGDVSNGLTTREQEIANMWDITL